MFSLSDDESSIGVGGRIKKSAQDRLNRIRFFKTSSDNFGAVNNHEKQISELRSNLQSINDQLNTLASSSHNHQPNHQIFGAINRGFKVNSQDVPVKTHQGRDLSPTGLSTKHAKEFLQTLNEYMTTNPKLDADNQDRYLDQTASYLKTIFKAQHTEDQYNSSHVSSFKTADLEPSFLKYKNNTYNANKIAEKSRVIHRQLVSIENCGLKSFLENIELCDVSDFTPVEYNMLIHMSLTKEIKEKLEIMGGHPLHLTTSEYLDRLNRILNGNINTAYDFDVKFASFVPQQKNIMAIYMEFKKFLENIPDTIISEEEKNRRVISSLMKLIPYSLHPFLNAIQGAQGGRITEKSFVNFLKLHELTIDRFLKDKKQSSNYRKR